MSYIYHIYLYGFNFYFYVSSDNQLFFSRLALEFILTIYCLALCQTIFVEFKQNK